MHREGEKKKKRENGELLLPCVRRDAMRRPVRCGSVCFFKLNFTIEKEGERTAGKKKERIECLMSSQQQQQPFLCLFASYSVCLPACLSVPSRPSLSATPSATWHVAISRSRGVITYLGERG